jgi:hypothetical protein
MALAVLNAVVKFPPSDEGKCVWIAINDADLENQVINSGYCSSTRYSQEFRDLITFMLVVEPKERPDIHKVSG